MMKEIFQIGLGLSQLNNKNIKKFTLNSIENLISYALARGIKYFDTFMIMEIQKKFWVDLIKV